MYVIDTKNYRKKVFNHLLCYYCIVNVSVPVQDFDRSGSILQESILIGCFRLNECATIKFMKCLAKT